MKKALLIFFVLVVTVPLFAQNIGHRNVVDTFSKQFNNAEFEKIYQSFSPKMQRAHSKEYYFDFLSKVRRECGAIVEMKLLAYNENAKGRSRGKYDATLGKEIMAIRITVNEHNQIIGLFFNRMKNFI